MNLRIQGHDHLHSARPQDWNKVMEGTIYSTETEIHKGRKKSIRVPWVFPVQFLSILFTYFRKSFLSTPTLEIQMGGTSFCLTAQRHWCKGGHLPQGVTPGHSDWSRALLSYMVALGTKGSPDRTIRQYQRSMRVLFRIC